MRIIGDGTKETKRLKRLKRLKSEPRLLRGFVL